MLLKELITSIIDMEDNQPTIQDIALGIEGYIDRELLPVMSVPKGGVPKKRAYITIGWIRFHQ